MEGVSVTFQHAQHFFLFQLSLSVSTSMMLPDGLYCYWLCHPITVLLGAEELVNTLQLQLRPTSQFGKEWAKGNKNNN